MISLWSLELLSKMLLPYEPSWILIICYQVNLLTSLNPILDSAPPLLKALKDNFWASFRLLSKKILGITLEFLSLALSFALLYSIFCWIRCEKKWRVGNERHYLLLKDSLSFNLFSLHYLSILCLPYTFLSSNLMVWRKSFMPFFGAIPWTKKEFIWWLGA